MTLALEFAVEVGRTFWILCLLAAGMAVPTVAQPPVHTTNARNKTTVWEKFSGQSPWVFLGDSNTYSGGYVALIDAAVRAQANLAPVPKILNLGMSSETASGLSEPDHPFPRPCVHQRIDKVLAMTRPGVVFICYGMNDGIYAPKSKENFAAYQDAMHRLAGKIRSTGAILVCLTPPSFETAAVAKKDAFGPSDSGRYAWFAPAKEYDLVVKEQADWCLENSLEADYVIDLRSALIAAGKEALSKDSEFRFTKDGVHFGSEAHHVVARKILQSLGAPEGLLDSERAIALREKSTERIRLLRDAYLSATGKNRPSLPAGLPIWQAEKQATAL